MKIRENKEKEATAVVSEAGTSENGATENEKPEKPEGEQAPPEKPEGEQTPPEKPEKPAGDDADSDGSRKKGEMKFAAEETVVTITSDTSITKGMGQEAVTEDELTADLVVRIVLDGTTVVSMDIMEME